MQPADLSLPSEFSLVAPVDGVLIALEDLPDPVFSGKLMGDGVAIDPSGSVLSAPCAGKVLQVHRAKHALTLRADSGASILLHIGLDTVSLGGKGFQSLVKDGDRVKQGQSLIEFDLDAIAQSAPSAAIVLVVTEGAQPFSFRRASGTVKAGRDEVLRMASAGSDREVKIESGEIVKTEPLTIVNPNGLHARPAAQLVTLAKQFASRILVHKGNAQAPATSVTEIMALDLAKGDRVWLSAQGSDRSEALTALKALIQSGLGEDPSKSHDAAQVRTFVSSDRHVVGGVPAAPGIAIGIVKVKTFEVPSFPPTSDRPAEEEQQLRRAIQAAQTELGAAKDKFERQNEVEKAQIFAAHNALLSDEALEKDAFASIREGASAAAAWHGIITSHAKKMSALVNPLMRQRADDLKDVGHRVLMKILGMPTDGAAYAKGTVLAGDELTPSDVAHLDPAVIVGLATRHGGSTSHAAIIARSIGVPYVAGLGDAIVRLTTGMSVIVNGEQGSVHLNPDAQVLDKARLEMKRSADLRVEHLVSARKPAVTTDGHKVEIGANIASAKEAAAAVEHGADGVGLLRSEFLFINRRQAPTEPEQQKEFETIGNALGENRTLVVRTLDVGGDKPLPYMPMAPEENPFLGIRGVRLSLRHPDMFAAHIRAILAAAPLTRLSIMFPMVALLAEFRDAKAMVEGEMRKLSIASSRVSIGVMVEVPSAAILADALAAEADFFSIGTNDLTQYALAMDRGHPELASKADALDPAVLRLIQMTVQGAHAKKRWVGICGGLAAEVIALPLLVGLDVDELSVPVPVIPELKAALRAVAYGRCRELAKQALALGSAGAVRALLKDFGSQPARGANA
jgi:phosphoenolpyruvate-protein phosphotransferase